MSEKKEVVVVACDVLQTEIEALVASRAHVRFVERVQQGLHNTPSLLRSTLQEVVTRIENRGDLDGVEAIVLGYGLCSRGSEEVTTSRLKLVLPRAHDCITLLLGSKERYAAYAKEHPGCYWYSLGWNRCHTPPGPERYEKLRANYVATYGEEDAEFLMQNEQAWFRSYSLATYVDLGLGSAEELEKDLRYTQECATWLGWAMDKQVGDPGLLCRLLDGPWNEEEFLVLEPGQSARMTSDERIVRAVGLPGGGEVRP